MPDTHDTTQRSSRSGTTSSTATNNSTTPILLNDQLNIVSNDEGRFSLRIAPSNAPPPAVVSTCLFTKCVDEGPLIFLLVVYWLFFLLAAIPASLLAYFFCHCSKCEGRRARGRIFSTAFEKRITIPLVILGLKKRSPPDPAETEPTCTRRVCQICFDIERGQLLEIPHSHQSIDPHELLHR
ncbi:hypothetical protein MMC30_007912 [Trapelia coarctata]|nr:hypothetical protein [Trapelia coarctata]